MGEAEETANGRRWIAHFALTAAHRPWAYAAWEEGVRFAGTVDGYLVLPVGGSEDINAMLEQHAVESVLLRILAGAVQYIEQHVVRFRDARLAKADPGVWRTRCRVIGGSSVSQS
jgi:hypothetical protein